MTMVEFFVPSKPRGKGSVRARKAGAFIRTYQDSKTRAYEALGAAHASLAMRGREPIAEPVALHLTVTFAVPVSWSKRKQAEALAGRVLPALKPDLSNCIKAVEDSCNTIVWRDDAQVVDLWVSKRYGAIPGVLVHVELASRPIEITWPAEPEARAA